MKLQIIETPDYILWVSDKEIKKGDWIIWNNKVVKAIDTTYWSAKKVIAYQPKGNAPELDLPLLPEIVVEDYSLEEAKKFAYSKFKNLEEKYPEGKGLISIQDILETLDVGVECGYRFASKAATKVYSEDDLRKAIDLSRETLEYDEQHGWYSTMSEDEIIKSLKQPKTPKWFVAEIETVYYANEAWSSDGGYYTKRYSDEELKTTTINGKSYLVGTYLYE
jgi:hypothetical protein